MGPDVHQWESRANIIYYKILFLPKVGQGVLAWKCGYYCQGVGRNPSKFGFDAPLMRVLFIVKHHLEHGDFVSY